MHFNKPRERRTKESRDETGKGEGGRERFGSPILAGMDEEKRLMERRGEGPRRIEPHGVAVWEIARGHGQRAHNRWALHELLREAKK